MKGTIFVVIGVFILAFFLTFYGSQFFDSQDVRHEAIVNSLSIPFYEPPLFFLTEAEQSHMHDVKVLFNVAFILLVICISALFLTKVDFKDLKVAGISILVLEVLDILVILIGGFTWAWNVFHKIFFPQGNFAFPADSTLINLYPENYFFMMVISIYVISAIFAILLMFSDKIYKFLSKKTN